jgi:glycosyltransferase involved in cell wall biosynthesis
MPTCAFLSFRLGLTDGVSVVARDWIEAFASFGFDVVTVAGEGPVDRRLSGLAIGATQPPSDDEVAEAVADADLVVVENVLTIPMNLPASRIVARVLRDRPALLHHHDPPWQRDRYRHVVELPPDDPLWRHAVINQLTAKELGDRGLVATVVYNGFDPSPTMGDRQRTRRMLGVVGSELLVAHPVRAIERKAVPEAVSLAEDLGATYWLTGAAEEDFAPELDRLLAAARCPVVHRAVADVDDVYAAADLVVFPSTWEGFGNPPIEASIRSKPVAVGTYPVLDELRALGFRWFDVQDRAPIREFLARPDPAVLEHNRSIAVEHFSLERMRGSLRALVADAGWLP